MIKTKLATLLLFVIELICVKQCIGAIAQPPGPPQDQVPPQVTTVREELLKQPLDSQTLQRALSHLVEIDAEKFTLRLMERQHLIEQSLFKRALLLLEMARQDKEQASGLSSS